MTSQLASVLKDPSLLREACFIDGAWMEGERTFAVKNPATGEVLGHVPDLGAAETQRAIAAAKAAQGSWAALTAKDRAAILRKWHALILEHAEDLALIMTAEQGKPLTESRGEVAYGVSFIEWAAEEGKRLYGEIVPSPFVDARIHVLRQPVGVVAAITPWNFPNAMITRKAGPALAAGCAIVVKPAEDTPLSALALAELAARAGIPAGVFNVITGDAPSIGAALTASPDVRMLSFTGSVEVGRLLMRQCADTVKKVSLELGGNAPFIVFDDADLDAAMEGALMSKYRNTGQTCVCANRIMVQAGVYDAFAEKLAEKVKEMKVGVGTEEGVSQGPLINEQALQKVERLVSDAREKGARVLTGGRRHALGGTFYEPTVICDITPEMEITREEIFGPVAPLMRFETEEEAIRLANDTPYGLAAYFYARDVGRVVRVSEALEYGIVGVNRGIVSTEVAPFGGVKESGLGREGGRHGVEEFTELKYVCLGGLDK